MLGSSHIRCSSPTAGKPQSPCPPLSSSLSRDGHLSAATSWPPTHFQEHPGPSSELKGRNLSQPCSGELWCCCGSSTRTLLQRAPPTPELSPPVPLVSQHGTSPGCFTQTPPWSLPRTAPAGCSPPGLVSQRLAPPVCAATCPYRFGGDVRVREVPVLTHDGDVAVHIDGQRVAGQHRDPEGENTRQGPGPRLGSGAGAPPLTPSRPC